MYYVMNKHILFDKLTVQIGSVVAGKERFFSTSIESPDYAEHLKHTSLEIPGLEEGFHEVKAQTLVGTLDPAHYVMQWSGKEYPTIIYHHGNNERQKRCYKNQPVKLLETGHITSLLAANQLRKQILSVLHTKNRINEPMQHVMAGI
jgi:hypothetical protein